MRKIKKIEILENGRIQVLTKERHELKDGSFIEGVNHRFAYNPGDVKAGNEDFEDSSLLDKAITNYHTTDVKRTYFEDRKNEETGTEEIKKWQDKIDAL